MRVLVTGAHGFVGAWLGKRLHSGGHEVLPLPPGVDVRDSAAVDAVMKSAAPDAVAHLAAAAFAPDAQADPYLALAVAVGGTLNVLEAARRLERPPVILVSGSAEVYGRPDASDLPLSESVTLAPQTPYALSKAAQEGIALSHAARYGLRVVVTRSFNHTGPGQRPVFVVPAFASRIAALVAGGTDSIPVGNLDVLRDITDVRDVVDAYCRLVEAAAAGDVGGGGTVVNVCSGRSVSIRGILEELFQLAGLEPRYRVEPSLVRRDDPPEIRGDPALIKTLIGWGATTPLSTTLGDLWTAAGGGGHR